MWLIIQEHSTLKTILNCHDWLDQVQFLINIKENNDVIDPTGAIYVKNDIELSWSIEFGASCDENQIGQLCDLLCICGLCRKWNWVIMTDRTRFSLR